MKIDLHIHTRYSDGTDSLSELLARLRGTPIRVFSVTDHDSIRAASKMTSRLRPGDPQFISGVELYARDGLARYHILGYDYDPAALSIRRLTERMHDIRIRKARGRLDFLKSRYGLVFPEADLQAIELLPNPGKPHIGKLLVRHGYAASLSEAFRLYVDPYRGRFEPVSSAEAIRAVLDAGGIPVLAHGLYGDGRQHLTDTELEDRVSDLVKHGLLGLECYYPRYSSRDTALMRSLCDRYELYATAGSDYHGTNKKVGLGEHLPEDPAADRHLLHFLEACHINPDR